jgi:hypothetical protein
MHLNIAAWMASHGSFHFDVSRAVWAVMPMAGDWLYASAYLAGGEAAARLANFAFLLLLAGFVYSLARRWLESAGALLVVALFLSTPLAYLVTGSMFVENAWTLFLMAAVAAVERWIETGGRRWLWVCHWRSARNEVVCWLARQSSSCSPHRPIYRRWCARATRCSRISTTSFARRISIARSRFATCAIRPTFGPISSIGSPSARTGL